MRPTYREHTSFNTACTDEIVCPYCGHEDEESYEYGEGALDEDLGLIQCEECASYFYARRHVETTYTTDEAKIDTCTECGENDVPVEDVEEGPYVQRKVGVQCCKDNVRRKLHELILKEETK